MNTCFTPSEAFTNQGNCFSLTTGIRISSLSCSEEAGGCRDLHFLRKVTDLIVHHIDDPELGVKDLCAATFTSYTQLFRRLKSLTGKSPTCYIRTTRLLIAKKRLERTNEPICEIAYSMGFTDPNYFSRVFRNYFGVPPSELRNYFHDVRK